MNLLFNFHIKIPIKYCKNGKLVVAPGYPCVLAVSFIYIISAIVTAVFTYDVFYKATAAVYIPIFIGSLIVTFYFNKTALTDAGTMPRRNIDEILLKNE